MQAVHVVRTLADQLANVTISRIGRVAMTTPHAAIEMPDTLVLVTDDGACILLRYGQGGMSCVSGSDLTALWPSDDHEPDEWLEVAGMPDGPPLSAFPATVTQVSARLGIGDYEDVLGLTLRTSTGAELVFSTGRGQLDVVSGEEMLRVAEEVARWAKMRIERLTLVPGS